MDYKDYYKILGIDRGATDDEIKRAYRKLARQLHPDVNPGDKTAEARFKDINEAYQVLGDPEKRTKYDRLGSSWQQWQRSGHDPGGFDWSQWFSPGGSRRGTPGGVHVEFGDINDILGGGAGGFSDFFNALFGGGMPGVGRAPAGHPRTYRRPGRGQNLEQAIEITLEEAYRGTTRTLERDGTRLQAKIPPGAKTGTRIRLAGQGAPVPSQGGGRSGDLYLRITVKPHLRFTRQGDDLHLEAEIDLYTAVLGGEAVVETLEGDIQLKIPAGTQSGQQFRLRGKGMPRLRDGGVGDLYVRVKPRIPRNLSDRERELYQELARLRQR
jgi:curved DNA-binding protein